MDVVLVSITGMSLALAVGMGWVALKVLREERQRAEARVALLVAAAGPAESSLPLRDSSESPSTPALPESGAEQVDLFVVRDEPSPWGRRFAAAGTLGALIALGAYALSPGQASTPPNPGPTVGAEVRPLELLGLRHTQDADSLTISGLVLNPRGSAVVRHVSASVVLFGSDGAFLASGRAGLDYVTLAPGDESPFVIKVPVAGTVSRYRVGFRGPDGAVIAHVDRRADGTSARNERIMGSVP